MDFNYQLKTLIESALREDIGEGDHSTLCCIPADAKGIAVLKIKQEGVLAGVEIAKKIFAFKEPAAVFKPMKKDGDKMQPGEMAFEVEAKVHTILQCERLVLNCMQRMSGIATLTSKYVDSIKGTNVKILDTRKTTPNFRLLEKEAVKIGGGMNHRFGLYDMIMLKDNHIDYSGGLANAIERAADYVSRYKPHLKVEIETRNLEEVKTVINLGKGKVNRIMLDNFAADQVAEAVVLINGEFETEASGGITLDNIKEYAASGVNFISAGALIHQAKSLDLSLKARII